MSVVCVLRAWWYAKGAQRTQKSKDLIAELLQQHIKFHPNQFKSENEPPKCCFPLTLWPSTKVIALA